VTAAVAVARGRGHGSTLGWSLAAVIGIVAVVAALFLVGAIPSQKWEPFLRPSSWLFFGRGLLVTLEIGLTALAAALALGIPLGMARAGLSGLPQRVVALWIELVRALPVLAILLIVFTAMGRLGFRQASIPAAIIGLTIYNSAVLAEIVRAGILAIPRGEVEASRSLGLGYAQTMRHVVLPQAFARMTPALVSQLITLIKDTSLASIIAAFELVGHARAFINTNNNLVETMFVVALIFFLVNFPLSLLSRRLEARQPAAERVRVSGEEDQVTALAADGGPRTS
jgi:aspartate/glutamate/glutamine transport system permease protein